ncbi:PEP-CTERM system histidine kinase PrsK [Geomonas sp. RF6]|uniref:XrtA/PEP-CTERM system histidine kinase PrsK n=1 Tax=Geomonas sp. RF6 TaxID=2897342 RepID=UPI001E415B94|nr:XrtA/PEP-CTERM system histidine kinase PrsK [Geomonas sp. RF6]UFS69155.1 PEP-CTERM system histidine kinase PrsK [Geomonas sp. RF6]
MAISLVAIIALYACALRALLRDRTLDNASLCVALAATATLELCDLGALSGVAPHFPFKSCALVVEALLPLFWVACSLSYARGGGVASFSRCGKLCCLLSPLLVLAPLLLPDSAFFYAPDFPQEPLLFLTTFGSCYYFAIMTFLVYALINFESTLQNASPEALWRVKLDVIALGAILAVLIFYYSHAILYRTLDMGYVPLRSTLFAVAAALMSYARLHFRGAVRITVSHSAAFKSVVFGAVACYLVVLGMLGVGMQYLGPFFPRSLTASVVFLGGVLLLVLLSSRRVKREVQVFLHKHFYPSKYDYRHQWLSLTERVESSSSGEEVLKSLLSAYCDTFGVQGAALFLHQEGTGWYCSISIREMDATDDTLPSENQLVKYLRERRWVFSTRDDNPEILRENEEFLGRHRISFIVPLFEGERLVGLLPLGALVKSDEPFIYEDYDLMKAMARQASLAVQHQRLSEELTRARALEAVGSLATFVVHDLKNQVATISLILENARQHLDNPEFQQDMMEGLGLTVDKMQRLIGRLGNFGNHRTELRPVDLLTLVKKSARQISGAQIEVSGTSRIAMADEGEMQKVVLNLLLNGIEASDRESPVFVEVGGEDAPYIRVADYGCGMSPAFLGRELFTPFRSTKKQGLGIGLYQCRQIVKAHGGRIDVSSVEGKGTVFTVWLSPLEESGYNGNTAAA